MQGLVTRNIATLVINKPRRREDRADAREHCWTAEESRTFLAVTHTVGPQMEAFYHLALDTGARRAELCGLLWKDVDLSLSQISLVQQLVKPGAPPLFGPPKNGKPRTITLTPKTVELLRHHKAQQAQTKLANRRVQSKGTVSSR